MTTALDLIFDEDTLRAVANAVRLHNDRMPHRTTYAVINLMKATAWDAFKNSPHGYCSTGGFDLCCWRKHTDPPRVYRVRASVAAMLFKQLPNDAAHPVWEPSEGGTILLCNGKPVSLSTVADMLNSK